MARRRRRRLSPAAIIRHRGIHKGFLGGHRGWQVVGGLYYGLCFLRGFLGRNEEIVAVEELQPGQFVRIEALRTPTRRERRRAAAE